MLLVISRVCVFIYFVCGFLVRLSLVCLFVVVDTWERQTLNFVLLSNERDRSEWQSEFPVVPLLDLILIASIHFFHSFQSKLVTM